MHALTIGFGLGFLVAMQLGPMSLFLIRSTLRWRLGRRARHRRRDRASWTPSTRPRAPRARRRCSPIDPLRTTLSLLGAAVLLFLGVRTLRDAFRVRLGAETDDEVASPRRAFATSAAATASNPLTIASWAAVFAARRGVGAAAGPCCSSPASASAACAGSPCSPTGTATARRASASRAMRVADAFAGAGLLVFGCALALRAD